MTTSVAPLSPEQAPLLGYAWWLTGDEAAARAAVENVTSAGVPPDDLAAVLLAVRRAAVDAPTMCPASELALLHDAHALPLHTAASVVGVDPEDAAVELAHGRLEALPDLDPDTPPTHPERLGGLAVGAPADVAHARQCEDCAELRERLRRGRDELRGLGTVGAWTSEDEVVAVPAAPRSGWLQALLLAATLIAALVALAGLLVVAAW